MRHILLGAGLCVAVLAGAASRASEQSPAQRPTKKPAPVKSQKLANPLNDLLEEARRSIERNDYQAAIVALEKFLAEQPDSAYAHFQLGYAYTALERWDEARGEYQRTIELDSKFQEAYLNLGILLVERDPAAAIAPLRKAVEFHPSQSRPRYLLGRALERSGDWKGALDAYEGAERLDPHDFEAVLAHGTALLNTERYADAEGKFRVAVAMDAKSAPARLGLARSLEAQQKPEVMEAYQSYLELQPNDRDARRALARIAFREKQYDTALAALDELDARQTPDLASLRLRADIQIAQKKWNDAIVTLRRGVTLAPTDVELQAGLGRVYLEKREFAEAETQLKTALRLDGNYLPAWKDLNSAYYLAGNCPAALATLDEVAKRETPAAGAWFVRATCCDKLRRAKDAVEAYQKFLEVDRGEHPDQVWQAQQRIRVLRRTLEKSH